MKFIKFLDTINKTDIPYVGSKAANLAELSRIGMYIPQGFVILTNAFKVFLQKNKIDTLIIRVLTKKNLKNLKSLTHISATTRRAILKGYMPKDMKEDILNAFICLKSKYVAVRSSANIEDNKFNSWAGQFETFLNIKKEKLITHVKKCWASLYSARALFYRAHNRLTYKRKISMAVIVQKMIYPDIYGICFTVHPVTKANNQIVIEVRSKLKKSNVDMYIITKNPLRITEINRPSLKDTKLKYKTLKKLAKICLKIENYYQYPQDIEWALAKDKFYILQTRPVTSLYLRK